MQFVVIYLDTQDSTQPYVALSVLEFHFCFFVLVENTQHQILLHCICQRLLWLVSSLFSWLTDGACLPCLAVKTSRSTVCIVSSLCEYYASNDICVAVTLSRNVLVFRKMGIRIRFLCQLCDVSVCNVFSL